MAGSFGVYSPDVTFPDDSVIGGIFPAALGCLGMGFLGVSLAESIKNIINPDVPMSVVGGPAVNAHTTTNDGANHFNSNVAGDAGDFTYAMVGFTTHATAGQAVLFMGNFMSGTGANNGDGLGYAVTGDVARGYFGYTTNVGVSMASLNHARPRLMVQRLSGTSGRLRVYDDAATPVARTGSVTVFTRNAAPARTVRIGAGWDSTGNTFTNPNTIAFWARWNRAITDDEIENELRPFLRTTLDPSLAAAV